MTEIVIQHIIEGGLIQFGYFYNEGKTQPFQIHLEWLASYPKTLDLVGDQLQQKLALTYAEYLLCPVDTIPLATTLSLRTGIPLVYSRGHGESPAKDLVGAYDVGHPTALILNVLNDLKMTEKLIQASEKVGLNVVVILAIISFYELTIPNYRVFSLLQMSELIQYLRDQRVVPNDHAEYCLEWLVNHRLSSKQT